MGLDCDACAYTWPRFSRIPRTLTLPTPLGSAFGPTPRRSRKRTRIGVAQARSRMTALQHQQLLAQTKVLRDQSRSGPELPQRPTPEIGTLAPPPTLIPAREPPLRLVDAKPSGSCFCALHPCAKLRRGRRNGLAGGARSVAKRRRSASERS
jgi:hypothetical protein